MDILDVEWLDTNPRVSGVKNGCGDCLIYGRFRSDVACTPLRPINRIDRVAMETTLCTIEGSYGTNILVNNEST